MVISPYLSCVLFGKFLFLNFSFYLVKDLLRPYTILICNLKLGSSFLSSPFMLVSTILEERVSSSHHIELLSVLQYPRDVAPAVASSIRVLL